MNVRSTVPRVDERRRVVRLTAAGISALVAILYLVLLFLVADAESVPDATDSNTYGGYLFLAVPYVVGAALLFLLDQPALWGIGAALQVFVIALFVIFGVGTLGGPGVFEYDAVAHLHMAWWAATITGAQVLLVGLLCYLAATPVREA